MSETVVLVPLPDGRTLGLELEAYHAALKLGGSMSPAAGQQAAPTPADEVLDAAGMQERTGVPSTWWLEAARRGDVPHLRCGKYVRFRVATALTALESKR